MTTKAILIILMLNIFTNIPMALTRPHGSSYGIENITEIKLESTDIIDKVINSTDILDLPIDTNSEILILETDDEFNIPDPGGGNDGISKDNMEAILKAESSRDVEIVSKAKEINTDKQTKSNTKFRNQVNRTNTPMEDIVEAEQDRDESLASFNKPLNQIAAKLIADNSEDNKVNTMADYVELIEVMGPTISLATNKSAFKTFANETGFYSEGETIDSGFNDIQTLFLACFATLLPLLLLLVVFLILRCLCNRWCRKSCGKSSETSSCQSPESSDSDKEELQKDDEEKSPGSVEDKGTKSSSSQPSNNGSIITMTLKNNHLIVETEETDDIVCDGIETRMKYSNEKDGIFIVKVQQTNQYRGILKQNSPPHDAVTNQQALVHREPDDDTFKQNPLSKTGLSISDLSLSSIERPSPSYTYTNQTLYDDGPFGYSIYPGYDTAYGSEGFSCRDDSKEPLLSRTPHDHDKPVVTAAIFKQDSLIGNEVLQRESYSIEGSSDGPLLSDVQAREISLQLLQEQEEKPNVLDKTMSSKDHEIADFITYSGDDQSKSQDIGEKGGNLGEQNEKYIEIDHKIDVESNCLKDINEVISKIEADIDNDDTRIEERIKIEKVNNQIQAIDVTSENSNNVHNSEQKNENFIILESDQSSDKIEADLKNFKNADVITEFQQDQPEKSGVKEKTGTNLINEDFKLANGSSFDKPKLTRADSLPAKMMDSKSSSSDNQMDLIKEEESEVKENVRLRKGSLPLIIPELRITVVDTLPSTDEDCENDNCGSPVPLITVTEEIDVLDNEESDNKS